MSPVDELVKALADLSQVSAEQLTDTLDVEPGRGGAQAKGLAVAAVRPVLCASAQVAGDRIPVDVGESPDQSSYIRDFAFPRTVLEEMCDPVVATIRSATVVSVDLMEALGESTARGLKHEVVVIRHHAPGEKRPTMPGRRAPDLADQRLVVVLIPDDRIAVAAPRAGVVEEQRIDTARRTSHARRVDRNLSRVRYDFRAVT